MKVAVVIPCYNEEVTIGDVVKDFRATLPFAEIYVCDNNSTDRTGEVARRAGANVFYERRPGKGNAVRRLFSVVDADIYLMVDGDNTYSTEVAPFLIDQLLENRLDMVIGARKHISNKAYRSGHQFGNRLITGTINKLFGGHSNLSDILSGYRVMSRRFVRSFPLESKGFDIETELTVHCLDLNLPIAEYETPYYERPEDSHSKLNTYVDGFKIGLRILRLMKDIRPMSIFMLIAAVFCIGSLGVGFPVVSNFIQTGLIPNLPSAVLSTSLMVISVMLMLSGLVLDSVSRVYRRQNILQYIQQERPGSTYIERNFTTALSESPISNQVTH